MKSTLRTNFGILILFASSIFLWAGCADPCSDQYCLNGGDCLDGDCKCPTGFYGTHCENEDTQSTSGYNCSSGDCDYVSSNAQYSSLSDCQSSCSGGSTSGYNCSSGDCDYVSSNAQYSSLSACQSSCSGGSTSGYNCSGGDCDYVSSNAQYSSLSACQSSCSGESTSGYNCSSGDCDYVSSNAQYSSLSACQSACSGPATGQLMIWNSNSQPCPAGAGSTISCYIDGSYVGGLSNFYTSLPSCGASGAITVTKPVGSYTVTGSCGSTNWGPLTISVVNGGCSTIQWQ